MINIQALTDRMIGLCGGRPIDITIEDQNPVITIWSDDRRLWVELRLTDNDLEYSDHIMQERRIIPALHNLDSATFPERMERQIAAMKRQVQAIKAA